MSRITNNVAPKPLLTTDASVVNNKWSVFIGIVNRAGDLSTVCTCLKWARRSSVHLTWSFPSKPFRASSKGDVRDAYFGKHLDKALNAPIKDLIAVQVLGGATAISAEILCGHGDNWPSFHCHPSMTTDLGQMIVLGADRVNPLIFRQELLKYLKCF